MGLGLGADRARYIVHNNTVLEYGHCTEDADHFMPVGSKRQSRATSGWGVALILLVCRREAGNVLVMWVVLMHAARGLSHLFGDRVYHYQYIGIPNKIRAAFLLLV